jgi:hypothetical protein
MHKPIPCRCRGLLGTVGTIAKEEGPAALWKGLEAGTSGYLNDNYMICVCKALHAW